MTVVGKTVGAAVGGVELEELGTGASCSANRFGHEKMLIEHHPSAGGVNNARRIQVETGAERGHGA